VNSRRCARSRPSQKKWRWIQPISATALDC
jgi:hypothetical protein